MCEVCTERGIGDVSVAHVVERAGVSRRTFYEVFVDREACFLATFDEVATTAARRAIDAYERETVWAAKVRSGLEALLMLFDEDRAIGRLLVVESLAAGAKALERRRRLLAEMSKVIDAGREQASGGSVTALTAEGVVGGVVSVIHTRLLEPEPGRLVELANPLMSMVVLPYLGAKAAAGELTRPIPRASARAPVVRGNPFGDLDMRLTYRTVRVLASVAANPGASNRAVGEASDIGDPGQTSKLLTRLHRLGLVDSSPSGSPRHAANSWRLTERGKEVIGVIATESR